MDMLIRFTDLGWKTAYDTIVTKRMIEMWKMYEGDFTHPLPNSEITSKKQILDELISKLSRLLVDHQRKPKWRPNPTNVSVSERMSSL